MTPQEIGSASYEVHQAAARFILVVKEASREVGFVAESAEPLFDAFRLRAAKALGSPEVNKATVRSLAALDDPADILAAIASEARTSPDVVRSAPHRGPIGPLDEDAADDPERWAMTARALARKRGLSSARR